MLCEHLLVALLTLAPGAEAAGAQRTRVAVLDLQYAGDGDRKAVEGLSALLATEVARRPALAVIAGADLRALIGFERQKALVGCSGGACAAELAGSLGVSYLVSSEVSRVGSSWLMSLALLDAGKATSVNRLTRKASSVDGLVEETAGAVDELLSALGAAGAAPPSRRFDGSWDVTITCPDSSEGTGAKGYAFRFRATVKDGLLVGTHLAEGAPGSLKIEGPIPSDGKARLKAHGYTAGAEFSVTRATSGTPYRYGISARFDGTTGTGRRLEGRACDFTFTRR
jgi:hypothetical protein